jgi:hypothetical protein
MIGDVWFSDRHKLQATKCFNGVFTGWFKVLSSFTVSFRGSGKGTTKKTQKNMCNPLKKD